MYTVECLLDIELSKDLCFTDTSQCFIDEQERVSVFLGYSIQLAVINTETEATVSFIDKQYRGCEGGLAICNKPLAQIVD